MKKFLAILYGVFLIASPITCTLILAFKPDYVWRAPVIVMMVLLNMLGIFAGSFIISLQFKRYKREEIELN